MEKNTGKVWEFWQAVKVGTMFLLSQINTAPKKLLNSIFLPSAT